MYGRSAKRKLGSDSNVKSLRKKKEKSINKEDKENQSVNKQINSDRSNRALAVLSIENSQPSCSESISNALLTNISIKRYVKEINEIKHNLKNNKFQRKIFKFGDTEKTYNSVLNFFHCRTEIDFKPGKKEKLHFTCIYCYKVLHEPLGKSGNFFKHFNSTQCKGKDDFMAWKKAYDDISLDNDDDSMLDDDIMDLTKYVMSSNMATQELGNIHLKRLLERHKIHLPCEKSFVYNIVPMVVEKIKKTITNCLRKAETITLIGDIWDSRQLADFFALCCQVTFADFSKKLIVLGLQRMSGPHNAENIILVSEEILNQYDFDKSKVDGYVSDGGKAFLRAFPQMLNYELENGNWIEEDFWEELFENDHSDENDQELKDSPENKIEPEINELLTEEINPIQIDIKFSKLSNEIDAEIDATGIDDADNYEFGDHSIVDQLEFELGSRKVPRFACTNHKFNISIRNTVRSCKRLKTILSLLCSFAKKTHQTIQIARIFQQQKNRLRNENLTRWSSSFLMLICFYKAYKKHCFETIKCPVTQAEIEFYLSLMLPAYRFTLLNQRNRVHIGDLVPSLHLLIMRKWLKKMIKRKNFANC